MDATVGLGGHTVLLAKQVGSTGWVIGLDVDESNLRIAQQRLTEYGNVRLFHENFQNVLAVLKKANLEAVDAILADLGVSSNQIESAERGFSFNQDGPLDMRLNQQAGTTAADLVNRMSEGELSDLIYFNSQEKFSRKIARAIHLARRDSRITTTARLAQIVCQAVGQDAHSHKEKIHPATRTFQALRIAVNRELEVLKEFLEILPRILRTGGRAGMISFHSLEDGICKSAFRQMKAQGLVEIITKKPITATDQERQSNPRSRSAKLRVIQRS